MKTFEMNLRRLGALTLLLLTVQAASAFYDPSTQRWINRDPLDEKGGLNLYRYTANDPVTALDPLGLATFTLDCHYKCKFKALGAVLPAPGACPGGANGVYVVATYVCNEVWAHIRELVTAGTWPGLKKHCLPTVASKRILVCPGCSPAPYPDTTTVTHTYKIDLP